MFNGIIYKTGKVSRIEKSSNSRTISIWTTLKFKKSDIGSSIACNGACLTLIKIKQNQISFYLSKETLSKTAFKHVKLNDFINLEKSINYGTKVSGHYVQGHVDTTGRVKKISKLNNNWVFKFQIPKKDKDNLIEKGSISINGVSLTIANVLSNGIFEVSVIPHTLKLTNLLYLKNNDLVNIEYDIFLKYFKKILS
jgi:riboflavin synthase